MALRYAVANGNWSNTATWDGGTLPTADDDVRSNNFTVTVDNDYTVLTVSNRAESPAVAGGSFTLANGVTLTCTASPGVIGGANAGAVQVALNATATLVADVTGSNVTNSNGVRLPVSPAVLTIVGNVTGGSGSNAAGVNNANVGTVLITGSVTGGSGSNVTGVANFSSGTISITGSVTGGSGSNAAGVNNANVGTVLITGSVTGGTNSNAFGAQNSSTGTLSVTGLISASNFANGIGPGSTSQVTRLTGPFVSHPSGMSANAAQRWIWAETLTPTYLSAPTVDGLGERLLYSENAANSPAPADVRTGVVYGPVLELTGTCAVPAASTVLVGVAVGNTVGTAPLTAQSIRDAVGLATANLDTQLGAIPTNPLLDDDARLDSLATTTADLLALARADEQISPDRYRKLAEGGGDILLDKTVADDGAGNISLTTEAP